MQSASHNINTQKIASYEDDEDAIHIQIFKVKLDIFIGKM